MVQDENLNHKIVKDDSDHSGIKIPDMTENDIKYQFVVHDDYIFQRFRVFTNGLIVCEEVSNGKRTFRSNRPIF